MSCTYKIATQDKKSIVHEEFFRLDQGDQTYEARMEQTWRWGYAVITDVEKDSIDPLNPNGFLVTDYDIEDQDLVDGVALYFHYSDNVTDEMKEAFELAWDQDGYEGVENLGWTQWDMEMTFLGPLEIELLEEVEDEEEEDVGTYSNTWPFPTNNS